LQPGNHTAARWLFGTAAIFNLSVAAALLLLRSWLMPILNLDPIEGSNAVMLNLTACFVGLFGYAFALVASDPLKYKPFIQLGAIGKMLAVAWVLAPWFMGKVPAALPVFIVADLIYALLFIAFLCYADVPPKKSG
jgi:hypothetical protein